MINYTTLRPWIFKLPPEAAHGLAIRALAAGWLPTVEMPELSSLTQELWGLTFAHPLGLAAGFDKNAEAMHGILSQGMAFTEAGTVTPLAQPGNPKPRMFRLQEDEAVINRLGFNNKGAAVFQRHMEAFRREHHGIVGINIGKNKATERAEEDYLLLLRQLYGLADYLVVNISSPNTPGLRDLQKRDALEALVIALMEERERLAHEKKRMVPLLVKMAPDMTPQEVADLCNVAMEAKIDGLIVSNTTISRPEKLQSQHQSEAGGLSGRPLMPLATERLAQVYHATDGNIPIVGVGGIASAEDAYAKIRAGASLLQLYSALVYQGFGLVREIVEGLARMLEADGFKHLSEAIGVDSHRYATNGPE